MGGNSRALNSSTGQIVGYAEKINLEKYSRSQLVDDITSMLDLLNDLFYEVHNTKLWKSKAVIESKKIYNGSSKHLFDNDISDQEFTEHKPLMGDIDVTMPKQYLYKLFKLLREIEGESLFNFKYLGQPKERHYGHQINSVFRYKDELNLQIDFEGVNYDKRYPTQWSRFSHSSNWNDVKNGFKGVHHKFLLINLVRAVSTNENIVVLTPKSGITNEDHRKAVKYQREIPRTLAFSVIKGLRRKVFPVKDDEGNQVIIENKEAHKVQKPSESEYTTDIKEMFERIFEHSPTKDEVKQFGSFLGLIKLMKNKLSEETIKLTFKHLFTTNLFGEYSQKLDRDTKDVDYQVKWGMVDKLMEEFPFLEIFEYDLNEMSTEYYKNYEVLEK